MCFHNQNRPTLEGGSMTERTARSRIRKLRIPRDAKEALLRLWRRCKALVEAILNFIRRHRHLSESLLLGAIVAFLLCQIPVLGTFLGLVALVTAGAVGLMRELRSQLEETFAEPAT
jgi:hypothetical protein